MKLKTLWIVLLFVTALQAVFSLAFAFDLPSTALPTDDKAALGLAEQAWQLIVTKQYALLLGPVIVLLVYGLRRFDKNIPKYGDKIDAFLNQPVVAFALPTVLSAVGGIGTAIATHQPPLDALKSIFEAAMSAVFLYVGGKKIAEQQANGAAAAQAVADGGKTAAIDELKKP